MKIRESKWGAKWIQSAWLLLVMGLLFPSCIHKELCEGYCACASAEVEFVFNWSKAPGADPTEMNLFLFPEGGGEPILHQFTNKHGGTRTIPAGRYKVIAFNNNDNARQNIAGDNFSGIKTKGVKDFNTFEAYLQKDSKEASSYANASPNEPIVRPGRQLWSASLQTLEVVSTSETQKVELYPIQRYITYTIIVEKVDNPYIVSGDGVRFEASLSGMNSGLLLGQVAPSSSSISTIAFPISKSEQQLEATLRTLGKASEKGKEKEHTLTIYYLLPDGKKLYEDFNFRHTDPIVNASDPYNIIIRIPKLTLPNPLVIGATPIVINAWKEEDNIPVKM